MLKRILHNTVLLLLQLLVLALLMLLLLLLDRVRSLLLEYLERLGLFLKHHNLFELLSEAQTLLSIGLILDEDLVYLSHFDAAFNLFNFYISLFDLATLFTNGALVATDELLGLSMLLGRCGLSGVARVCHYIGLLFVVLVETALKRSGTCCYVLLGRRVEHVCRLRRCML